MASGLKGFQLVFHFHQFQDITGGTGIDHITPGNLFDMPACLTPVIHRRTDPHAAHQHLARVFFLLNDVDKPS